MGESPCPRWTELFQEINRTNNETLAFIAQKEVCNLERPHCTNRSDLHLVRECKLLNEHVIRLLDLLHF